MSRFLFVVPPLTGHVNPTVSVAAALERRGHQVAWVGHPTRVRPLLPEGAQLFALDDSVPREQLEEAISRARKVRGLVALKELWEDILLPLARSMVPGVDAAADAFGADALVVDHQALAGMLVARMRGLPWATLCTTSASVTDSLGDLPKVKAWHAALLDDLQRDHGLEPCPHPGLSPDRVVVFSTGALVGPEDAFPPQYRFVGPAIRPRGDDADFPWEALRDDMPRVLVSLGTVNAERGARFYRAVVEGLADEDVQLIVAAPPELVGEVPERFVVRLWVPQLHLLPRMDAVIGHGGHNTVCESLAQGLPMVLAPIRDDQPVVAQQVVDAGAGLRVRYARVGPSKLREALLRVLREPGFREAAERVRDTFERAGGAEAAADALEVLT